MSKEAYLYVSKEACLSVSKEAYLSATRVSKEACLSVSKEAYLSATRVSKEACLAVSNEAYLYATRGLCVWQKYCTAKIFVCHKRFVCMAKESYSNIRIPAGTDSSTCPL